jgi:hypothetical protein
LISPGWAALAAFAGGVAFFFLIAATTAEEGASLIVAIRGFFAECAIFIAAIAVLTARRASTAGSDVNMGDAISTGLLAAVACAGGFCFPVPALLAAGVLARRPELILNASPLWLAMLVASPLLPAILWIRLTRTAGRGGT